MAKNYHLFIESLKHFRKKGATRMGAALSYYAIFTVAPLSILIMSLVGFFYGSSVAESSFVSQVEGIIGFGAGNFVESLFLGLSTNIANISAIGLVLIISTILFATFNFFSVLSSTIDLLWDFSIEKSKMSLRDVMVKKITNFSIIPIAAMLFLAFIFFSFTFSYFSFSKYLIFEYLIFFVISASFFTLLYRIVPNKKLPTKELLFGGVITAILFMLGRLIIVFYIANFAKPTIFGAAGSLVAILIWIYYSSQVFFFGATCTYIYSRKKGFLKKTLF